MIAARISAIRSMKMSKNEMLPADIGSAESNRTRSIVMMGVLVAGAAALGAAARRRHSQEQDLTRSTDVTERPDANTEFDSLADDVYDYSEDSSAFARALAKSLSSRLGREVFIDAVLPSVGDDTVA